MKRREQSRLNILHQSKLKKKNKEEEEGDVRYYSHIKTLRILFKRLSNCTKNIAFTFNLEPIRKHLLFLGNKIRVPKRVEDKDPGIRKKKQITSKRIHLYRFVNSNGYSTIIVK